MRRRTVFRWMVGTALLTAAACGGSAKPVKVSGRISLDGKPLPGATVVFTPADGNGNIASGRTNSDGEFRLTTFSTDDGAVPGDYKITVKIDEVPNMPGGGNPMQMNEAQKREFFMRNSPKQREAEEKKKKADSVVPAAYRDITKTPLKQRVPADGKVEIDLESKLKK
ncbi:MAG TPA: carboxypeptidase-like regulatory domain-containing protein [Fimbriiglobus sp.]|nr:carboxypeptidase-like regulatory domain-containing protein [Fimbriiglobus sp.]